MDMLLLPHADLDLDPGDHVSRLYDPADPSMEYILSASVVGPNPVADVVDLGIRYFDILQTGPDYPATLN